MSSFTATFTFAGSFSKSVVMVMIDREVFNVTHVLLVVTVARTIHHGPVDSTFTLILRASASCLTGSAYFAKIVISAATSVGSRRQFSVENAYTVSTCTPSSQHHCTKSISVCPPDQCPCLQFCCWYYYYYSVADAVTNKSSVLLAFEHTCIIKITSRPECYT